MMHWLRKIFSYFLGQLAYQYAFKLAKQKAMLIYLKTLQAMRRSLLLAILVFCFLQIMIFSFFGLSITAIWLLPTQDLNTKLYILLGFFGFLFVVPALGFVYLLSERFWFRLSGAEQMLKD